MGKHDEITNKIPQEFFQVYGVYGGLDVRSLLGHLTSSFL
jgi:hypothetical protein